jgi:hypothetical protein
MFRGTPFQERMNSPLETRKVRLRGLIQSAARVCLFVTLSDALLRGSPAFQTLARSEGSTARSEGLAPRAVLLPGRQDPSVAATLQGGRGHPWGGSLRMTKGRGDNLRRLTSATGARHLALST